MALRGSVEPYERGTWKFFCECGGENKSSTRPIACTRIVNDSEINFRCETPIVEASQKPCMIVHQLAPLVAAYERRKKREDAQAYLETMEAKKKDALETLGITEAQANMAKNPPLTSSGENS